MTIGRAMMLPLVFGLPLALGACSSGSTGVGSDPNARLGPAPQLTVERFLESANQNDWGAMARLFGTPSQNIVERDGAERGERRMQLLASLLRHDDYVIQGREGVPGRTDATRIVVRIIRDGEAVSVPFLVVERNAGGWIIERIDNLDALT